ncbi:hypothetical protein DMUE_1428 [Dictyocoela muelleri]|nr:hypothetical protein DMUE_1428 [Dictyocoela muelleri]
MKQRFNFLDIRTISNELQAIENSFIQNIYSSGQRKFLFKLNTKNKLLIEPGIRVHLTDNTNDQEYTSLNHFCKKLRLFLRNKKIRKVYQHTYDRIIVIEFYPSKNQFIKDNNEQCIKDKNDNCIKDINDNYLKDKNYNCIKDNCIKDNCIKVKTIYKNQCMNYKTTNDKIKKTDKIITNENSNEITTNDKIKKTDKIINNEKCNKITTNDETNDNNNYYIRLVIEMYSNGNLIIIDNENKILDLFRVVKELNFQKDEIYIFNDVELNLSYERFKEIINIKEDEFNNKSHKEKNQFLEFLPIDKIIVQKLKEYILRNNLKDKDFDKFFYLFKKTISENKGFGAVYLKNNKNEDFISFDVDKFINQWEMKIKNDNKFNENTFNENTFNDNKFNENTFNENTFNENTFNENTFNDNNFNDNNFNDNNFNDNNFNDNTFNDNNFNDNNSQKLSFPSFSSAVDFYFKQSDAKNKNKPKNKIEIAQRQRIKNLKLEILELERKILFFSSNINFIENIINVYNICITNRVDWNDFEFFKNMEIEKFKRRLFDDNYYNNDKNANFNFINNNYCINDCIARFIKKSDFIKKEVLIEVVLKDDYLKDHYSSVDNNNKDNIKDEINYKEQLLSMTVDLTKTAFQNINILFEKKRKLIAKLEKTESNLDMVINKETKKNLKNVDTKVTRRKSYWFEKFHFFFIDNLIIIGGKDEKMNEVIVKKYLGDFYFHCDCRGGCSLTFLEFDNSKDLNEDKNIDKEFENTNDNGNKNNDIKDDNDKDDKDIIENNNDINKEDKNINKDENKTINIDSNTLLHIANAALCLSSSWDNKIVNPVYYVNSSQVSKTAPTGEYLPIGSFMIRGKKNYINVRGDKNIDNKNNIENDTSPLTSSCLRLEYGIGIVFKTGNKISDKFSQEIDHAIAVSGPWSLLKNYKFSVKLVPGIMKRKILVKKVISIFMERGSLEEKIFISRIHVDEFYNVLIKGCKIGK